jgi:hypothetical protein
MDSTADMLASAALAVGSAPGGTRSAAQAYNCAFCLVELSDLVSDCLKLESATSRVDCSVSTRRYPTGAYTRSHFRST